MDLINYSARELRAGMDTGKWTAVEVVTAYLDQIDAVNPQINAIVLGRDRDDVLADAAAADRVPVAERGLLHGLPMAPKDMTNLAGVATTFGSPLFVDFIPPADSLLVSRLRGAGAVFVGKTNTPEMGLGSHTFNPVHGATHNPFDYDRSAGGSSGGAAAALATNMLPVADGSDMMGSLRNPAAWCNVYGFRPTWGLVPNDGPGDRFLATLATEGPMGRNVGDLAMLLDVIAGPVATSPFGRPAAAYSSAATASPTDLRIGWLADWGGAYRCELGVLDQVEVGIGILERMGHRVEAVPPPFPAEQIWDAWVALRSALVSNANRQMYANPEQRALMKPELIWEIETGAAVDTPRLYDASLIRTRWYERAARLFDEFDVLVMPAAQVWPFPIEWRHPQSIEGVPTDTYHRWMEVVVPVSLIGLPSLAVPVGMGANGLPMGMQLIGATGADADVLALGAAYERAFGDTARATRI